MICYATRFKFLIVLAGYMNLSIHIDRVWSLWTTTCRPRVFMKLLGWSWMIVEVHFTLVHNTH